MREVMWKLVDWLARSTSLYCFCVGMETLCDVRSEEKGREFFSILARGGDWLTPKRWDHPDKPRSLKFNPDDLAGPLELWTSGQHLWMLGVDDDHLFVSANTCGRTSPMTRAPRVGVSGYEERRNQLLEQALAVQKLARDLQVLLSPVYGHIQVRAIRQMRKSKPLPDLTFSLPDIYWINFFGKPYVDMIGEGKLASAPCHEVEKLPDGSYMLTLTADPYESASRDGRVLAEAVKEHLGSEYFYHPSDGQRTYEWEERGRRPVPDLDWSKTPMREEPTPIVQPAPEVNEFIEQVPHLIESLKTRIGDSASALDYSKDSLEAIDVWLVSQWEANVPREEWQSEEVSLEIAAYLGEVVRRLSNGEWRMEEVSGQTTAVVRFGPKPRQMFDPRPLVDEVLLEGVEEAATAEVGILQTGLSPTLWVWMTSHMPKEAIKSFFGR